MSLKDDQDVDGGVGIDKATAGADAVFFRAGGLDLEGDSVGGGVGERHCDWDVLPELEPVGGVGFGGGGEMCWYLGVAGTAQTLGEDVGRSFCIFVDVDQKTRFSDI